MEPIAAAGFCTVARLLADAARGLGLRPPGFRSPPRASGAARTIRRYPDGQAVIAVRVRGRPRGEVVVDMVEGVVVANGLGGRAAEKARRALLASLLPESADEPDRRPRPRDAGPAGPAARRHRPSGVAA